MVVFCIVRIIFLLCFFFFFNDTATTVIYTLSLHDALPILTFRWAIAMLPCLAFAQLDRVGPPNSNYALLKNRVVGVRSEEHTSELQSQFHLVCRLLLEKKKNVLKQGNTATGRHLVRLAQEQ